jgi:hypothetical protein
LVVLSGILIAGSDTKSQVADLLKAPDASVSGTFEVPAKAVLIDNLLSSPITMAHLWEAYDFTPRYTARLQGNAIHVDDPTGIQGDIYLAEQSPNRRVYYGTGAINHSLVPAFQGSMAIIATLTPKGSTASAHLEVSIRTDSRILGVITRTLFPLVRSHAEHRMTANMKDLCTILNDITTAPQQTAAKLKKEDAANLLKMVSVAPEPKGSGISPTKAAPSPKPGSQPISSKKR